MGGPARSQEAGGLVGGAWGFDESQAHPSYLNSYVDKVVDILIGKII